MLQRSCACGGSAGPSGQCSGCDTRGRFGAPRLQAKLTVGAPNDPYEREADAVADRVMRMPGPAAAPLPVSPLVQRQAADPDEDEMVSAKAAGPVQRDPMGQEEEEEEGPPAQRKAAAGAGSAAPAGFAATLGSQPGGAALPATARSFFEPRFQRDLGHVRIHDGASAAAMARGINARAFTHGRDIYFAHGQFDPDSQSGRRLIAHELTHVAQQGRGAARTVLQRDDGGAEQGGTEKDKLDAQVQEVNAALTAIESNWQEVRAAATFDDLAGWVSLGDSTVALLRTHTEAALAAMQSGDSGLFSFYLDLVESDKVMYDNIAWHVVYVANLLGIDADMDRLIGAFAADDRAFTERASAEELVNLLSKLVEIYSIKAHDRLSNLTASQSITVRRPGSTDLDIVGTSAYDADNRRILVTQTSDLIQAQVELQTAIAAVNGFLATAQSEGLWQAVDAVQQFYLVRGQIRGQGPQAKKNKGKKDKGQGKGGRWGCDDVRCNVYPDPQADPPNTSCPPRVIGTSRGHASFAAACLAAQQNANAQVPRGCIKRHCNCTSKCRKM
jgi:hypothetical protein